ncbi:hypothetical protein BpHYR1_024513 [Brachionus plicatilis]|uniref:Uncharacterized protein n=1 Tax=Brachionus plicatilis TaxID=10195 RepID=A0A3M7QL53_BRAPC|nr:hypothetical protein BpHYR1_024513 [Brachionus plicatilis]
MNSAKSTPPKKTCSNDDKKKCQIRSCNQNKTNVTCFSCKNIAMDHVVMNKKQQFYVKTYFSQICLIFCLLSIKFKRGFLDPCRALTILKMVIT